MSIRPDCVVTIHYTLKDETGEVLDSSAAGPPLTYLHGHGHLIPGLERALEGKAAGETLSLQIAPADGYGEYDSKLIEQVPRRTLKGISGIKVGMQLRAETESGPRTVWITRLAGDLVTIDGNHPLAGRQLNFEVQIASVRDATQEELTHGHVHGAGGHDH